MKFAAQIQACIELLESQLEDQQIADKALNRYFRGRRYIGSKDRAAIITEFYAVLRSRLALEEALNHAGLTVSARLLWAVRGEMKGHDLNLIYTGERFQPAPLSEREQQAVTVAANCDWNQFPPHIQCNTPLWLYEIFSEQWGDQTKAQLQALNQEAPVDLRVNALKATREEMLQALNELGINGVEGNHSPWAIRLNRRRAISSLELFRQGLIEVQDEGSQLLALMGQAQKGEKVIDFCAGAGGKTLSLAASMENKGQILACDVSEPRLKELRKRCQRAGVFNVRSIALNHEHDKRLKRHANSADLILIDAPCSGTGAWRRNPDARFNLTRDRLLELNELQSSILAAAAKLVKPGGRLVYATCSVLRSENEEIINKFIQNNELFQLSNVKYSADRAPDWSSLVSHGLLATTPLLNGTDGFFAAHLNRRRS